MKIVFISNFLNHHQLPLCENLVKKTDNNFVFIAQYPVPQDRKELGYHDMNDMYDFVLKTYESEDNYKKAKKLIIDADVAIIGDYAGELRKERLDNDKLSFYYMERIYKYGYFHKNKKFGINVLVPNFISFGKTGFLYDCFKKYKNNKNLYLLSASNYIAGDMALLGCFRNKSYKWGYFPRVLNYDIDELMRKKDNSVVEILWVGRLINWKHPEVCIQIAEKLVMKNINFHISIIGIGELFDSLNNMIQAKKLDNYISLLGSMSPESVRVNMEKSNIFLFTSDYKEGWGATLNEAMNSGCAVVANDGAGSTKFLIKNNENGFIYRNKKAKNIYKILIKLIENKTLRERIGKNAYLSMINYWNADIASDRLIEMSKLLLQGKKYKISDGPCSKAKRVYKGFLI